MPPDPLHQPDGILLADGACRIWNEGVLRDVRIDSRQVRGLGADLPVALSRLLHPLLLVECRGRDGESPPWLLDREGNRLGTGLDALPADRREDAAATVGPILDWLRGDRLADGQPEPVAAFLSLQPGLRRALERAAGGPAPPLPEALLSAPPAGPPADHTLAVGADLSIGRTGLAARQGDAPAALEDGWRALRVCTLFFPVLLLELEHANGDAAAWYLDHHGCVQGQRATLLPPRARRALARALHPLFAALWRDMLLGPDAVETPSAARFFGLHEAVRLDLLELMLQTRAEAGLPVRTTLANLADPLPAGLGHVARTRSGLVALDRAQLRAGCLQSLHESFAAVLRDGWTGWPSPVDGVPVRTALRPLTIDNLCFAYQLHDARHDLTFHVVALEWHFRTFGLYIPAIDLLVAPDAAHLDRLRLYCLDFTELLQRHLALHGASILRGAARRRAGAPGPLLQLFRGEPSLHIGHYVWQDLSGLDWLLRHVPGPQLPHCLVFDSRLGAEMYGPIDAIHPALRGRVLRRRGRLEAAIPSLYETASRPMRFTSMQVRRSVGVGVMDAIDRDPAWQAERARAEAVPPGTPVVLVGLRVGNRAPEDQAGFVCRLAGALAQMSPGRRPVIVLDGHNQATEGTTYRSVGDDRPGAVPLVEAERAIAAAVAQACAALGLTLVDTVGRPVAHSLIWCRRAQFFVAPWGAALAKYRWICNRPGLVMTGRWNLLTRRDLDIYGDPRFMEAPSELRFLPAEHVEDVMLEGELPDRANFRIDEAAAFALVRELVRAYPP